MRFASAPTSGSVPPISKCSTPSRRSRTASTAYQSTLDLLHHTPDRWTVHRRRWKIRGLAGTSRGREWVREVPQCGRLGFDPRGAVRPFGRRHRHHPLAPDQIARGDDGGLTRQRVGRGDQRGNPFSGCCRSISIRRRICKSKRDGFGPDDKPSATVGICADGTAGVDVERHSGSGSVCRNWADSVPTGAASGTTAVRAIGGIPRRARSTLPHLGPDP